MPDEKRRVCKKCDEVKNISMFPITKSKNSKSITYRHTCKECEKNKRRAYFKEYHKKKYVSKKKKPVIKNDDNNDSEIDIEDTTNIILEDNIN